MDVTCRNGERIGRVKRTFADGEYFQVDCRFAPDLYVPMDAVHDTNEGVVHLKVTHAESMNLGWEAKPKP
jgi:hypothetical protein